MVPFQNVLLYETSIIFMYLIKGSERNGLLNIKVALLTPEAAPATREDIQWLFEKRAEALRGVQLYIDEQFQIFIFKCLDSAHGGGTIKISTDVDNWTPAVDQYLGAAANASNPNDFGEMQPDLFIKKRFGNFRAK
jgi:hypothetical protein